MIEIQFIVLDSQVVCTNKYDHVELAKRFLLKCRHSKKVRVIGVSCVYSDDWEYLQWYC
mgnify:CR=1 FL=1